jgi:hypothetical protein
MLIRILMTLAAIILIAGSMTGQSGAAPLAGSNGISQALLAQQTNVEKVHGWHCATRYSYRRGWHRHWRACRDRRYRHSYRRGCWQDRWGDWHCMNRRYHHHPRGCWFGPGGVYCQF